MGKETCVGKFVDACTDLSILHPLATRIAISAVIAIPLIVLLAMLD